MKLENKNGACIDWKAFTRKPQFGRASVMVRWLSEGTFCLKEDQAYKQKGLCVHNFVNKDTKIHKPQQMKQTKLLWRAVPRPIST